MTEEKKRGLMGIRKERGLSRREIANRSGVNFRSLQDYEQGHKSITSAKGETLYRLSLALGCTIEDLLEDQIFAVEYAEDQKRKGMERARAYEERLEELRLQIEQEDLYSKKYGIHGRWKILGDHCLVVFLHKGEIVRLPFPHEFTSGRLVRLAGKAVKYMEAYVEQA